MEDRVIGVGEVRRILHLQAASRLRRGLAVDRQRRRDLGGHAHTLAAIGLPLRPLERCRGNADRADRHGIERLQWHGEGGRRPWTGLLLPGWIVVTAGRLRPPCRVAAADAGHREIPGLEADLRRRAALLEPEVAGRRVDEQRIGKQAPLVAAHLPPGVPGDRAVVEQVRCLAVGAPVEIVAEDDRVAGIAIGGLVNECPAGVVAVEQCGGRIPGDDVALVDEAEPRLVAGAKHLCPAAEGEDVVADAVGVAVVLMEAGVPGVVHEVVFGE